MNKMFYLSVDGPVGSVVHLTKHCAMELINRHLICKWAFIDPPARTVGFIIYPKKRT